MVTTKEGIGPNEYTSNDALTNDPDFLFHFTVPIDDPVKEYELYQISTGITIRITEITKEIIRGTFSSKEVTFQGFKTPAVTDGEFFVKRTN